MRWSTICTIYAKELRDLLRDRRTVISMIVIPMLLMPGLTATALAIAFKTTQKARAETPTVMVIGAADSPKIRATLAADRKLQIVPTAPDWQQRISDKQLRAAVDIPGDFDAALARGEPANVTIYHYRGEMRSNFAVEELQTLFGNYRGRVIVDRLAAHGLSPAVVKPFAVATKNVAPPEKVGGNLVGGLIPYFFLLLSFTGAMYPAMDLTAGEKERGTMETLLCSPVPRLHIVLGKFLMILTASLATMLCSLVSTLGTLFIVRAAVFDAGSAAGLGALPAINAWGLVGVVAMVIPMAVLFSAAQFTIGLCAKSFKEAQSYISPLAIVIVLPAMIGLMPGVELNARLALVPVLNVSLVSKELVSGVWHWNFIALIFLSSCAYAGAALAVAARMFQREDVIFRA